MKNSIFFKLPGRMSLFTLKVLTRTLRARHQEVVHIYAPHLEQLPKVGRSVLLGCLRQDGPLLNGRTSENYHRNPWRCRHCQ